MTAPQNSDELQLLQILGDQVGKLEKDSVSTAEFATWFMSSEWEARMADNSSALRLGWDIQNILYEWQDFPDTISSWRVTQNIREAMQLSGLSIHSLASHHQR